MLNKELDISLQEQSRLQSHSNQANRVIKPLKANSVAIVAKLIKACKVEFNQPSCWLYSVSNLVVF